MNLKTPNMKAIRLLMALAAMCMSGYYVSAQDFIVKKDGSVIQAKVTKIGTSEVEYKKWSNQNGPQYSIAVADILAINYQNGEKETFENVGANLTANETPSNNDAKVNPIEEKPVACTDNAELIAKYNSFVSSINAEFEESIAVTDKWLFCAVVSSINLFVVTLPKNVQLSAGLLYA